MMETKRPAFEYKSIENNTVPSFLQDKLEICNSKRCQRVHHGTELLFNHSHDMSCACSFSSSALSSAGSSKRHKLFCMFWRFASSSKGLVALICVPLLLSSFNEPVVFERQSDNEHGSWTRKWSTQTIPRNSVWDLRRPPPTNVSQSVPTVNHVWWGVQRKPRGTPCLCRHLFLNVLMAAASFPKHQESLSMCGRAAGAGIQTSVLSVAQLSLHYARGGWKTKNDFDSYHGDQQKEEEKLMSVCVRRFPHSLKARHSLPSKLSITTRLQRIAKKPSTNTSCFWAFLWLQKGRDESYVLRSFADRQQDFRCPNTKTAAPNSIFLHPLFLERAEKS